MAQVHSRSGMDWILRMDLKGKDWPTRPERSCSHVSRSWGTLAHHEGGRKEKGGKKKREEKKEKKVKRREKKEGRDFVWSNPP